jgi:Tfp pilus assembly protein PilO
MIDYSRYSRYSKRLLPLLKRERVRAYGMLILSLFTASFFGVFAIRPTVTTIIRLKREISDKQSVETALSKKITALSSLDQVYRRIEEDLVVVETVLPSQPQINTLTSLLERIAAENKLGILSIQFQPVELIPSSSNEKIFHITPISFTATFVGSYPDLISGLANFGSTDRLLTVETVEMGKHREGEEVVLSLHGRGYYVH